MIADLKPYPAMKDAGAPWLGKVPEHWEVLALKRLGWFKSGAGFPIEQQGQRDLVHDSIIKMTYFALNI